MALFLKTTLNNFPQQKNHQNTTFSSNEEFFENSTIQKPFHYKEKFFKIKKFEMRHRAKSLDAFPKEGKKTEFFIKSKKEDIPANVILPKQNKINIRFIEKLKSTLNSELFQINKTRYSDANSFLMRNLLDKKKIMEKFAKDKQNLQTILKKEKRRSTIIPENEENFYDKLEKLNRRFQTIHTSLKDGKIKDPSQFISYLDFQTESKNKDYLLTKNKTITDEETTKFYFDFHRSK